MAKLGVLCFVLFFMLGCSSQKVEKTKPLVATTMTQKEPEPAGTLKDTLTPDNLPEKLFLTVKVKEFGKIKVQMFPNDAPLNVCNVTNLAIKGFYHGLTFHRIVPGFVVQGGDPKGDGTGGPGYTVTAEIKRKHEKGSMAMARLSDEVNPEKRSSGSQFYFCLQPLPQLDGNYTVIGRIVEGIDVLDRLGEARPPVVIESITASTD